MAGKKCGKHHQRKSDSAGTLAPTAHATLYKTRNVVGSPSMNYYLSPKF